MSSSKTLETRFGSREVHRCLQETVFHGAGAYGAGRPVETGLCWVFLCPDLLQSRLTLPLLTQRPRPQRLTEQQVVWSDSGWELWKDRGPADICSFPSPADSLSPHTSRLESQQTEESCCCCCRGFREGIEQHREAGLPWHMASATSPQPLVLSHVCSVTHHEAWHGQQCNYSRKDGYSSGTGLKLISQYSTISFFPLGKKWKLSLARFAV